MKRWLLALTLLAALVVVVVALTTYTPLSDVLPQGTQTIEAPTPIGTTPTITPMPPQQP
jgi:hypothetical protein